LISGQRFFIAPEGGVEIMILTVFQ